MIVCCVYCSVEFDRKPGEVNRAIKIGLNLYCSKACSGLNRRKGKTVAQRKEEKRIYDQEYRRRDPVGMKAKKAAYYQRTHDPVKEAATRKARMPKHIEYCRKPEYVEYKRKYDRRYRALKDYGEFAECALLVLDIRDECLLKMTDYDIRQEKGTLSKTQKRRREYERSIRNHPEEGSLGNIERGERGQNGGLASGLHRLSSKRNSSHNEHTASHCSTSEETGSC